MYQVPGEIQSNKIFIIGFSVFFCTGIILAFFFPGHSFFFFLNSWHYPFLDTFFMYVTFLGDGLFVPILFILLLLCKRHLLGIQLLVSFLASGLLAQACKHIFQAPRPKACIDLTVYNNFIEGVTHSGWNSFPSGHTTTVFAIATILALHCKKKSILIGYLLIAILVGYSRIYLGHHFPEDVLAGASLGLITSYITFHFLKNSNWLQKKTKTALIIKYINDQTNRQLQ